MKKIVIAIVVLSVFIAGLWFVALPEDRMIDLIESSLKKDHLYLKTEGFKKGLFYNFSAETILLEKNDINRNSEAALLTLYNVNGRVEFMSFFKLNPEFSFDCRIGNGVAAGKVGLTGKHSLMIRGDNIRINGIPFLESIGLYGDGILSGSYSVQDRKGEIRLSLSDAKLKSTYLGGVFLPLDLFNDIKGVLTINDETVEVQSLTMSGKGVYGRVRGSIKTNRMDMTLELMTDSSDATTALPLAMLEMYKAAPGYYVIPLKGEVPHPRSE